MKISTEEINRMNIEYRAYLAELIPVIGSRLKRRGWDEDRIATYMSDLPDEAPRIVIARLFATWEQRRHG